MDEGSVPRQGLFQDQGMSLPTWASILPDPGIPRLPSPLACPTVTLGQMSSLVCHLPPHGWGLSEAQMVSAPHLSHQAHSRVRSSGPLNSVRQEKPLGRDAQGTGSPTLTPLGNRCRDRGVPGAQRLLPPSLSPEGGPPPPPIPTGDGAASTGQTKNFPDLVCLGKPV